MNGLYPQSVSHFGPREQGLHHTAANGKRFFADQLTETGIVARINISDFHMRVLRSGRNGSVRAQRL